jgi:hypothetical protein
VAGFYDHWMKLSVIKISQYFHPLTKCLRVKDFAPWILSMKFEHTATWRKSSSGIWCRVVVVRTYISEERIASTTTWHQIPMAFFIYIAMNTSNLTYGNMFPYDVEIKPHWML